MSSQSRKPADELTALLASRSWVSRRVDRLEFLDLSTVHRTIVFTLDLEGLKKLRSDETDAADVLIAIFLAEAEAFRQMGAHRVAIEHFHPRAELAQFQFQQAGDGAFTRAAHAGEPQCESFVHFFRFRFRYDIARHRAIGGEVNSTFLFGVLL